MKKATRNPFIRFLVTCKKVVRNMLILSFDHGQAKSIFSTNALDRDGKPIPWFTYPALQYLGQFDLSGKNIFEYGAGNSSIYWSNRGAQVISVEGDKEWFEFVNKYQNDRFTVILASNKADYIHSIEGRGRFDLVIVDGRYRYDCAALSVDYLADDGMLILDNSDWYPDTVSMLREMGFFQIDFSGFGPINSYCWTTSIFIRAGNRLQVNYRDPVPIGGIQSDGVKHG